jgi:hypothetical protein
MEKSKPLAQNIGKDLSLSEVLKYFQSKKSTAYPALKAKAGEVYLIIWKDDSNQSECIALAGSK